MPRTVKDILEHADEPAARFEDYEPKPDDERDPVAFRRLCEAVSARADAERTIAAAVEGARTSGYSWAFIGKLLGTSGEAARQRHGHKLDAESSSTCPPGGQAQRPFDTKCGRCTGGRRPWPAHSSKTVAGKRRPSMPV